MPIYWRYLLKSYFKVLLLSNVTFVAILLTMRLEEIARFATLGAESFYILKFVFYQIPYILPIALPISSLISTILLTKTLSTTHELTAFRACGLSLKNILAPILLSSLLLSVLNFYIVSELSTHSHLKTSFLKNELRAVNPLLLLHNKHLMQMKGIYFDTLGSSRMGENASDIIIAMPNQHQDRLHVVLAKHLKAEPDIFSGNELTLISGKEVVENQFDNLVLENISQASVTTDDFSQMVQKKVWTVNNDHLSLPLLFVRLNHQKETLNNLEARKAPKEEVKKVNKSLHQSYVEIVRRFSLAIAVFSFTLMGTSFGISISRNRSSKGLLFVMGLTAMYLISYFAAKGIDHLLIASSLTYLIPHVIIILLSIWNLRRITRGVV